MAINPKLLNDGEHVVFSTRTHVKALFWPALALLVLCGLTGYLLTLPRGDSADLWRLLIVAGAAVLVLVVCVIPFVKWRTTTYTVTNRRLITRRGVITRSGHDIVLNRINDVSYERGLLDRLVGCGTLVISDASEVGRVELHDIPSVERAQLQLSDQLFHGERGDDGT